MKFKCCTSVNNYEIIILAFQSLGKKSTVTFSCKTNLQFLSSIDAIKLMGHTKERQSFTPAI